METCNPIINTVILESIPISMDLKRYYASKFRFLAKHNGLKYAADVFKQVREIALAYRADPHRSVKRDEYLAQTPVRKNGWLSLLFDYLDSQPDATLNFLKLYCGLDEPVVSVTQSADTQHTYLADREAKVTDTVPGFLDAWLFELRKAMPFHRGLHSRWMFHRTHEDAPFHRYCGYHSFDEWCQYWKHWTSQLSIHWMPLRDRVLQSVIDLEPLPEMYCDWEQSSYQSESLERDLWCLNAMQAYADGGEEVMTPPLSIWALNYVMDQLAPELWLLFDRWSNGEDLPEISKDFLDGTYVGHIHHIPKKGTVKRRPIAVPNRFLQMGMGPAHRVLEAMLKQLEKDCTFNQAKFDMKIQNRVNNPNLYVGSVDLSQATDNLPFTWGERIWDEVVKPQLLYADPDIQTMVTKSWNLFCECTRAPWENDGQLSRWTVGQPLGCLPSFAVLGLTHNLFLESLALSNGLGHSPYCVLGDDLLVFNKKLRKKYIQYMVTHGIPLSLHKSYQGNLVEFAGKLFVKGAVPFHTPDQSAITYGGLFDWQRASGIPIPYSKLPKKVRAKIESLVVSSGLKHDDAAEVYNLLQLYVVSGRYRQFREEDGDLLKELCSRLPLTRAEAKALGIQADRSVPDQPELSGIVRISGYPITYLNYGYAEKHGYKQRFRKVQLPVWYEEKFRPYTTDQLFRCGSETVIVSRQTSESLDK
jgi:hypothetical protein